MLTKFRLVPVLIAVLLFSFGQTVQADLARIGPVDINTPTDFPIYVQDADLKLLGPCDRVETIEEAPGVLANAFPCIGLELVDPGVPGGPFGEFVKRIAGCQV